MGETFFSDGIYLFMCLLPMVTCTLTGIPTVQSYDKVSVPARGFRPGAASFPTCRAAGLLPRVYARSHAYRSGRGTPASQGPLEGENGVSFFPNWRNFVTQLGSKFF
ncbi:MAG: hypothetical protein ACI3X9_10635, partial [Bacteroidaceae bacterium]